ncbi:MAG TPA: YidB family protein [Terracidiphilus sp.]|nr:YidB family protein [Terracidiphilus sp.]
MSFFDSVTKLAEGFTSSGNHAAVATGLMEELGGSGGVAGLIQAFHQNGASDLVQQFANGQTQGVNPGAIEQAVGGSAFIDSIAQRTGVSADSVRSSLATIVPVLVNHVTANGHVTTDGQPTDNPPPDSGTLIRSVLGRLL